MRNSTLSAGLQAAALLIGVVACHDPASAPDMAASADPSVAAASGQWITRANLPGDRIYATTATVPGAQGKTTLYVIGGRDPNSTTGFCEAGMQSVQAYDAATNKWTTKAGFPRRIQRTNGAGVIQGKIYLTGGCSGFGQYRGWTWVYDPATNTWTEKRSMPVDTWGGNTGVIGDKLYVLSSCDGQEDCGTRSNLFFGYYDPATDTWTSLPTPPSQSGHLFGGSAVIGGKFYVVGGGAATKAVEIYDPATNQWTTGAAMGSLRTRVASAALAGKMYVIAGWRVDTAGGGSNTPVAVTSRYDPVTDTWTNLKVAPRSGPGLAAGRVVVNGQPRVALVGGVRPGNNLHFQP